MFDRYIVEVQSVLFNNGTGNSAVAMDKGDIENGKPLTMGIDSGSPALGVSMALGRLLMERTGAKFKLNPRVLEFGCDVVDAKASFDFKMSDKTVISIPLSDFLRSRIDNDKTCQLAVQPFEGPAGEKTPVLLGRMKLTLTLLVLLLRPLDWRTLFTQGSGCL